MAIYHYNSSIIIISYRFGKTTTKELVTIIIMVVNIRSCMIVSFIIYINYMQLALFPD